MAIAAAAPPFQLEDGENLYCQLFCVTVFIMMYMKLTHLNFKTEPRSTDVALEDDDFDLDDGKLNLTSYFTRILIFFFKFGYRTPICRF